MKYAITVNGATRSVEASEDTPLLWALREQLGLQGTKFGCGVGQCGACTLHLGEEAVRSCVTPISAVGDMAVRTIEGVDQDALGKRVQQAWLDLAVVQCGYCQPAQIMSAIAMLRRIPDPTDEQIDSEMTVLCRCGTYPRIRAAIHRAARGGIVR